MCCYRDIKNYERFNLIVQSIICLTVCELKGVQNLIENKPLPTVVQPSPPPASSKNNNNGGAAGGGGGDGGGSNVGSTSSVTAGPSQENNKPTDTEDSSATEKETSEESTATSKLDPKQWTLPEVEKLLILISKAFLLNFPLYIAYKHGVHSRLDDISAQEAQVIYRLCD